ncbi:MAG: metal-sensing transcriptional repressor [Gammaproteobacteria bacterium]|nr:metal-sensing transcriptional repressor [Gammaproteobacteria bacterium]
MTAAAVRVRRDDQPHVHQSHTDVVNRLKRAAGHLQTIIGMFEKERDCLDIAQQMQAVIKAVENAKTVLIHDHVEHCLEAAVGPTTREQRATIEKFKKITRYL